MTTTSAGPHLEPSTQRFVDAVAALGLPPIHELQPQQARQALTDLQSEPVAKLPADVEDRTIPGGPTGPVSVRIFRPQGARDVRPGIVYFHGGGWILGGKDTHDRLVRELVNGANATVVFVNYTPSPEAKFPVPIEEAYAVAKFVGTEGATLNIDSSRIALAGDSAGGNMVAVVSLLASQRGGPTFKYQLMFYPVTNADFDDDSYREFADGPWLTRSMMQWFFDAYAPNLEDRKKPTVSPLQASLEDLSGQAPALIITDENDVLRDEGEAYAHKLMKAGVPVKAVRVLGTHHDFVMLNALAETPEARGAIELANRELKQALHPSEMR
jgi:acetyl esterase